MRVGRSFGSSLRWLLGLAMIPNHNKKTCLCTIRVILTLNELFVVSRETLHWTKEPPALGEDQREPTDVTGEEAT